jgi:hypothetical protein
MRLHASHDVRGFRGHDGVSARLVGGVADSSGENTWESKSAMFNSPGGEQR